MKKCLAALILAMVLINAYAQVPRTISYQGFYTDASGNPVNGSPHKVLFRFFDAITNAENTTLAREIENIAINKGIISVVIGGGDPSHTTGPDNGALPLDVWSQSYKIQVSVDGTAIGEQVPLTTVPYAFVAGSVDGANVTGTLAASKISGTLAGSQVGTGINATNITTGTLSASLLADGSIPGSKLSSDINASNISTGTLADARLESTLDVTAVNTTGTITTGGGLHVGSASDPGVSNLVVDGTITSGASKFVVDGTGNVTKLNNLSYSFPSSYSATQTFLANNGSGTLTWASTLPVSNGGTGGTTASTARANLSAASSGSNSDITSLSGLTTPLSVAQGGTGVATLTGVLVGSGNQNLTAVAGTANQYLRRNGANNGYEFAAFSLVNADINGSAAIADSKLATISTSGKVSGSAITSGTIGGSTSLNSTGNVVSTGYGALTNGLHIGNTTAPSSGNLEVDGFTKSGSDAPSIKMKKLTGTTAAAEGNEVLIAHGLTVSKIISVSVIVEATATFHIHEAYTNNVEYQFNWYLTDTQIRIWNTAGNSGNILSKPVKILITYEQ
ncbi:MAG TPA: hypothetical protein VGD40_13710 [Chryseosolibacter sp.]